MANITQLCVTPFCHVHSTHPHNILWQYPLRYGFHSNVLKNHMQIIETSKKCSQKCKSYIQLGLRLLCSKLLPIILLESPKIFIYYSFVLSLLFQNYSQKIHLLQASKQQKVMKLNPWCWLQTLKEVRYDCSIGMSECSVRVYRSFITTLILQFEVSSHCFSLALSFS